MIDFDEIYKWGFARYKKWPRHDVPVALTLACQRSARRRHDVGRHQSVFLQQALGGAGLRIVREANKLHDAGVAERD